MKGVKVDTIEMKMQSNGSLSTGSLYELNQQAYDRVFPLNKTELRIQLANIYEWTREQRCKYTMLLCHDRRDYTIFRYKTDEDKKYYDGAFRDLQECLENRGKILDIQYLQDQDAWEIWVRVFEDKGHQNYMYMFFNAEGFIVEV
jgi:hypothetical protein